MINTDYVKMTIGACAIGVVVAYVVNSSPLITALATVALIGGNLAVWHGTPLLMQKCKQKFTELDNQTISALSMIPLFLYNLVLLTVAVSMEIIGLETMMVIGTLAAISMPIIMVTQYLKTVPSPKKLLDESKELDQKQS
ncbi:MAG: hypothetical protein H0X51_08085 [Parachlamydiaceae bacterium]|nr:hypothetical protein [Parachlamydiaceae bacterium]